MDEENGESDLTTWDRLLNEQTVLFRKTAARNAELEAQVEELERELSVWKAALKTADEEKKTLNKTILRLERNIGSLREDNPLVLCLIDGDGNIFSPELITLGQAGGRQAAMLLTKGLTDYLSNTESAEAASGRGQIWLTIYCNKSGLVETLTNHSLCSAEQFEAFVAGFNQASPLFSIVDVGNGKEAADAKIKECLRVFTRFPQTVRVFFGGAHDNGYTSTLNYLQNEGLLDKIVLLRGYKDLAHELKSLGLPHLEIEGVFMTKKLPNNSFKKITGFSQLQMLPSVQLQDFEKFRSKAIIPTTTHRSPTKRPRRLDPEQPLHKQKPPPCNFYYLAECKQGQNCRFGHDYVLLPEQVVELREASKKWPCPSVNRGQPCHLGDACCMSHVCPKGPRCSFAKAGKCKFIGEGMHRDTSSYRDNRSERSNQSSRTTNSSSHESAAPPPASLTNSEMYLPSGHEIGMMLTSGPSNNNDAEHNNNSLLSRIELDPGPYGFRVPERKRTTRARAQNRALLESLGLGGALIPPGPKAAKRRAPRKRKASVIKDGSDENEEQPKKSARIEETANSQDGAEGGPRRSGRNRGKVVDYKDDGASPNARFVPQIISAKAAAKEMGKEPRNVSMRIHDPKVFGPIPGISVGTWWERRDECSIDAVHAPVVAGIAFGPEGAYSVALSGGYEDDVDLGDAFTYTGSGGRDLKGTKTQPKNLRTAPQSSDQSFDHRPNMALMKSCETKKPVRVIRGFKLRSPYAPSRGYRYDGLYTVEKGWMEKGLNPKGYKVCKFALKRMAGQVPIQFNTEGGDSGSESDGELEEVVGVKDQASP
ncbi:hypothetical protein SCP_0107960 [Sparassis crispa]|uniref:Uncharacterized protein n=1 Tax=Sparassis crispa TaxID=139825 RepID=A0A401G6X5_9APHY|nr:hypothetical protein SCP_0107960 [Sparassis crispa]GBE77914.1 hypothetical protein SCP_0107960 [Sparassis crispa]